MRVHLDEVGQGSRVSGSGASAPSNTEDAPEPTDREFDLWEETLDEAAEGVPDEDEKDCPSDDDESDAGDDVATEESFDDAESPREPATSLDTSDAAPTASDAATDTGGAAPKKESRKKKGARLKKKIEDKASKQCAARDEGLGSSVALRALLLSFCRFSSFFSGMGLALVAAPCR